MEDNNFDMDIDNAWDNFLEDGRLIPNNEEEIENIIYKVPKGTNLYISTKTKITYLSSPIDLYNIFFPLSSVVQSLINFTIGLFISSSTSSIK